MQPDAQGNSTISYSESEYNSEGTRNICISAACMSVNYSPVRLHNVVAH